MRQGELETLLAEYKQAKKASEEAPDDEASAAVCREKKRQYEQAKKASERAAAATSPLPELRSSRPRKVEEGRRASRAHPHGGSAARTGAPAAPVPGEVGRDLRLTPSAPGEPVTRGGSHLQQMLWQNRELSSPTSPESQRSSPPARPTKECFVVLAVTLQDVDTVRQTFVITGYINLLWRCPDLEREEERHDYYSPEHQGASVKELLGQVEEGRLRGYVKKSVAAGVTRKFVTGFDLSVQSDVLPLDPARMFEDRRIVADTFHLGAKQFYYYPLAHNHLSGLDAVDLQRSRSGGLGRTASSPWEKTASDGQYLTCAGLIKMTAKFSVQLTQRMDMHYYPFDRQILSINIYIRRGWEVKTEPPEWLDTGYDVDRRACTANLSEAIVHYAIEPPWIERREPFLNPEKHGRKRRVHTIYLRIERKFEYELRKIVLPLFIVVLTAMSSFGLDLEDTDNRIGAPIDMMLATIAFQYVILETMP